MRIMIENRLKCLNAESASLTDELVNPMNINLNL